MQRERVVTLVARMRIRAVFEQEPDGAGVPDSDVQRSGAIVALVNETWLVCHELAQRSNISGCARGEERLDSRDRCHGSGL